MGISLGKVLHGIINPNKAALCFSYLCLQHHHHHLHHLSFMAHSLNTLRVSEPNQRECPSLRVFFSDYGYKGDQIRSIIRGRASTIIQKNNHNSKRVMM